MSTVIRAGHSLSSVTERQASQPAVEPARDYYRGETPSYYSSENNPPEKTTFHIGASFNDWSELSTGLYTEYSVGYGMGLHVRGILPLKPLSIFGKLS